MGAGLHDALLAQLSQDPYDDLADRAGGVGELLLGDRHHQLVVTPAPGSEVEQVPGHPLSDGRKGTARELPQEGEDPFTRLGQERVGHPHVPQGELADDPRPEPEITESVSAWMANGRAASAKRVATPTSAPARQ